MRAAMTCIGFTVAATQAVIEDQGMDSLKEIQLITDDEIEESLCKVIRYPGGTIPVPPGGPEGGAANIPNSRVSVNQQAEAHLELMTFYLCHQARVSRTVLIPDITLNSIRTVRKRV